MIIANWNIQFKEALERYKLPDVDTGDCQHLLDFRKGKLRGINDFVNNLTFLKTLDEQIEYCDKNIPPFYFRKIIALLSNLSYVSSKEAKEYDTLCKLAVDVGIGCESNGWGLYRFYKGFKILSPYMSYNSSFEWVYKTVL